MSYYKENVKRLREMLETAHDANLPKWALGAIEMYFTTDSPHLYVDEFSRFAEYLRSVEAGEKTLDSDLRKYLDHEIVTKVCETCGSTFETFESDDAFCSMACYNEKVRN